MTVPTIKPKLAEMKLTKRLILPMESLTYTQRFDVHFIRKIRRRWIP